MDGGADVGQGVAGGEVEFGECLAEEHQVWGGVSERFFSFFFPVPGFLCLRLGNKKGP